MRERPAGLSRRSTAEHAPPPEGPAGLFAAVVHWVLQVASLGPLRWDRNPCTPRARDSSRAANRRDFAANRRDSLRERPSKAPLEVAWIRRRRSKGSGARLGDARSATRRDPVRDSERPGVRLGDARSAIRRVPARDSERHGARLREVQRRDSEGPGAKQSPSIAHGNSPFPFFEVLFRVRPASSASHRHSIAGP